MTFPFLRAASRPVLALLCLASAGCYVPGGGWTARAGLDTRRPHKPSAFVEVVDTRWDEYNRIATMNLDLATSRRGRRMGMECPTDSMPGLPPPTGNGLPPGQGLPPGFVPEPPPAPSASGNRTNEPNPLPGSPAESFPPRPPLPTGDGPTARRQPAEGARGAPAGGDSSLGAAVDDDFDDMADDEEELASNRSHWLQRVSARTRGNTGRSSGANGGSPTSGAKSLVRPSASRLFSRPQ